MRGTAYEAAALAKYETDTEAWIAELQAQLAAKGETLEVIERERDSLADYAGSQMYMSDFQTADQLRRAYETAYSQLAAEQAEREELRKALESIKSGEEWALGFYESHGPQWTIAESGVEYYEADYVNQKRMEIIEECKAALALAIQPAAALQAKLLEVAKASWMEAHAKGGSAAPCDWRTDPDVDWLSSDIHKQLTEEAK